MDLTTIILLVNSILSIASITLMLFITKSCFDTKHQFLKLFQFGYCSVLMFNLLATLVKFAEVKYLNTAPTYSDNMHTVGGIILSLLTIPYLFYFKHKKKTQEIA